MLTGNGLIYTHMTTFVEIRYVWYTCSTVSKFILDWRL